MDWFKVDAIRAVRRVIVAVVGMTALAVGVALLVLPGPAFVVIPVGLGILAIEFEWARRWLRRAKGLYRESVYTSVPTESRESTTNEKSQIETRNDSESR